MTERDWIESRLRAARLRPTLVRRQVLETLSERAEYLRTDDIYRKLIERNVPANLGAIYRALRELHKASLVLCFWDGHRAIRYGLPSEHKTPSLRLVCRGNDGGEATFFDPELHAHILSAAARQGLRLDGQAFELHACFKRQDDKNA
jgi:Fe2+ or Zn2+ uptake regulation protein